MADKAEFFYTTLQPHAWNSGPTIHHWNEKYEPIANLEEAKALALQFRAGKPGHDGWTKTTYGVTYETEEKKDEGDDNEV